MGTRGSINALKVQFSVALPRCKSAVLTAGDHRGDAGGIRWCSAVESEKGDSGQVQAAYLLYARQNSQPARIR
jgi:hypothetical protein